jgi:membrane-bound lytic murein transglycosylase B
LVRVLGERQIAVAVVNPRQVRDFANGIGKEAKTDAIDAEVLATFGEVVKPAPTAVKTEAEQKLGALVTRRPNYWISSIRSPIGCSRPQIARSRISSASRWNP